MKNIAAKKHKVLDEKKRAYKFAEKEALEAQNNVKAIKSKVEAFQIKGQLQETFSRLMKNIAAIKHKILEEKKNAYEFAEEQALEAQNNVQAIKSRVKNFKVKGQLEETFPRFPHIAEQVFENLDAESLSKCLEVSKCWNNFLYETNPFFQPLQFYTGIPKAILKKYLNAYSYRDIKYIKIHASRFYKKAVDASISFEKHPKMAEPKGSKLLYYLLSKRMLSNYESKITKMIILNKMDNSTLMVNDEKNCYNSALCDLIDDAKVGTFGKGYTSFRNSIIEKEKKCDTLFSWIPILRVAIAQNYLSIVKLIFEKTQEIHPIHELGKLMLQHATFYGHREMCEFIGNKIEGKSDSNGSNTYSIVSIPSTTPGVLRFQIVLKR